MSRPLHRSSENGDMKLDPYFMSPGVLSIPKKRNYFGNREPLWDTSALKVPSPDFMDTETSSFCSPSNSTYLESVLAGFGLKLNEEGLVITDQPEDINMAPWLTSTNTSPSLSPTFNLGSVTEEVGAPAQSFTELLSPSSDLPPIPASNSGGRVKTKKVKMFELEPLSDEEEEKKRLNAVNAKRNRDMKKKELLKQRNEIESLQKINQRCSQVIRKTHSVIQELGLEVQQLKDCLTTRDSEIRKKNFEIRQKREEMALLSGHLDLIGGSLEEHNPAKNLIVSLLRKLPTLYDATSSS